MKLTFCLRRNLLRRRNFRIARECETAMCIISIIRLIRIYDYDRRDKDGNARELHVEKAQCVSRLTPSPEQKKYDGNVLADCKYFTVEKIDCNGEEKVSLTDDSFRSLVILSGDGEICLGEKTMSFTKGDSIFIPAQNNEMRLCGKFEAILSYV